MARGNHVQGRIRIIAGKYRGRTFNFLPEQGTRPTHDRVRETLFNWLQPYIVDAYCLDLFSGSGALGFEASSRGASHVLMCEKEPMVCKQLELTKESLHAQECKIKHITFNPDMPLLSRTPFDIVFLDPPYHQGLIPQALAWLISTKSIHENSVVYFEIEKKKDLSDIEAIAEIIRIKSTSTLMFGLLSCS